MRILGLIPARGGSKGVPGKNIRLLGGKPLLAYTAEVALESKRLEKVILSSDDPGIISIGKSLGLEAPFVRPAQLAEDASPTLPVVLHALDYFEKQGIHFDAVCLLQVTTPFRTVEFLNQAIDKFIASGADSLVSVREVPHQYNPHWTFTVNDSGFLTIATGDKKIISRRQELPAAYHRDGSIYLTRVDVIKQQRSLLGSTIAYLPSPDNFHVNIDTPEDWEHAEKIASDWKN